jgi:CheY-like chemotaxis protein
VRSAHKTFFAAMIRAVGVRSSVGTSAQKTKRRKAAPTPHGGSLLQMTKPSSARLPPSMARIAVIDDAQDDAEIFQIFLTRAGHDVQVFRSGTDFIQSFVPQTFDLVLLDVGLPEVDGYAIFDRIRHVDLYVPVIAVTAYASPGDAETTIRHGFNAHIPKPILDWDLLLQEVERFLPPRPFVSRKSSRP